MGLIARNTKTGGTTSFASEVALGNDTILDSEVDADFDTAYAELNGNLDDDNIKVGANIATAKLAQDAGIVNAHIATAAAIAGTKLAVGAVAIAQRNTPVTPADVAVTGSEATLADDSITTTGGKVDLRFMAMFKFGFTTGSIYEIRFYRGATLLFTLDSVSLAITSAATPVGLVLSDAPAAGTYTYAVKAILTTQGGLDSINVRTPRLEVIEWR